MGFFSPSQPRLARLPRCISHWLGHRESPPAPRQNYLVWFWSFIGAFCGISILQAVFGHAQYFMKRSVPSIIASYVRLIHARSVDTYTDHGILYRVPLPFYATGQSKHPLLNLERWLEVTSSAHSSASASPNSSHSSRPKNNSRAYVGSPVHSQSQSPSSPCRSPRRPILLPERQLYWLQ